MRLQRKAWDISLAYCWAPLPAGKLIALKYPKGYERKDNKGNPLYMIMRKNCYGHPAASKAWSDHRDQFLMERFSRPGWSITKCTYDPCLFYVQKDPKLCSTSKDGITTWKSKTNPDTRISSDVKFDDKGILDPTYRPASGEAWISIHTDDCDAVGTSDNLLNEIYSIIDAKWKSKIVPENYMLGVKRTTTVDPKTQYHSCVHTMEAYVEICTSYSLIR